MVMICFLSLDYSVTCIYRPCTQFLARDDVKQISLLQIKTIYWHAYKGQIQALEQNVAKLKHGYLEMDQPIMAMLSIFIRFGGKVRNGLCTRKCVKWYSSRSTMNVWKWKYMETRYAAADDDDKDNDNNNAYISKHKYAIA